MTRDPIADLRMARDEAARYRTWSPGGWHAHAELRAHVTDYVLDAARRGQARQAAVARYGRTRRRATKAETALRKAVEAFIREPDVHTMRVMCNAVWPVTEEMRKRRSSALAELARLDAELLDDAE